MTVSNSQSVSKPADVSLRLSGIAKTFGDVRALRGLDVEVPHGVVGVLGPNGAGKSTMFRILLGLERADRGEAEQCESDDHNG